MKFTLNRPVGFTRLGEREPPRSVAGMFVRMG